MSFPAQAVLDCEHRARKWSPLLEYITRYLRLITADSRLELSNRHFHLILDIVSCLKADVVKGTEIGPSMTEGSQCEHRCRSIRFPAATAQIGCGELAQRALLADWLLLNVWRYLIFLL